MGLPTVIILWPDRRSRLCYSAHLVLAIRDPSKAIPGLDAGKGKHGRFQRVQADLAKPGTVRAAVETTAAENAFIYRVHGIDDHMRSAIEALKSARIKQVVFPSSYTVRDDPEDVPA